MQFEDIPRFPRANYEIDVSWNFLEKQLGAFGEMGLDLNPDFQRGHVWSEAQQVAFIEYSLRGGKSARNIYFNCANWHNGQGPVQLIDGKQRLEAVRKFMRDELWVFDGYSLSEMGKFPWMDNLLRFHVHSMPTRADVLRWYLGMNNGGAVHSKSEIKRVKALLADELLKEGLSNATQK